MAGAFRATPLGEVFVSEQIYGEDYSHGNTSPLSASPLSLISQWANDPRIAELPINKFAFLDTETSGLAGGTGTYAFLVGAARFVDGKFVLQQFFMRDPAEEPALLEGLAQFPGALRGAGHVQRQGLRRTAADHTLFACTTSRSLSRIMPISICCRWRADCGATGFPHAP